MKNTYEYLRRAAALHSYLGGLYEEYTAKDRTPGAFQAAGIWNRTMELYKPVHECLQEDLRDMPNDDENGTGGK